MSAALTAPEPVFPKELEFQIFKVTAQTHPSMRKVLVLVARRAQMWIEPLLYEQVVLHTPIDHKFVRTIAEQPQRFATHVKTLSITWTVERSIARDVLAICRDVVNLTFMTAHDQGYWPLLSNLRPQRLSIHDFALLTPNLQPDFHSQFFRDITHLHLVGDRLWIQWPLSSLPSLTHLALDYTPREGTKRAISDILSNQNLEKLVAFVEGDGSLDDAVGYLNHAGIQDDRLVVLEPLRGHEELDVWERIAQHSSAWGSRPR